jgi:hypothetical protein
MGKTRKVKVSKVKRNNQNFYKNRKRMQSNIIIINELKRNIELEKQ